MKRFALLACLVLAAGCASNVIHRDFRERMAAHGAALQQFYTPAEGLSADEKAALEFLYAYMPTADVSDYPTAFYVDNVRASVRARKEMGWAVPDLLWRHFVLPVRVNNENLDSSRVVFYRELKPRVQGLSMADAILEVNHWCHEKVTYQPSDARTTSPLATVKNALGRCGEESTFCVAALRAVGIPARQVYTPRWAHTDDNHAWVEAWADGQWHFLGACEPEPVLDLGWFNAPASRAMLMHTKVFGRYEGPEEVVLRSPNYTEVNLIDHYARTARVDFRVVDAVGKPVEGARVDFCIYNYAEFYPAVSKYTGRDGRTVLSAGLGDLLVWASKDGRYTYGKASFGKDSLCTLTLGTCPRRDSLLIVPPPEAVRLPEVSPAQRALNDRRFAREDSLRHAYEATFYQGENQLLLASRGNWRTLQAFLAWADDPARADSLLRALSGKDLRDISPENLRDAYCAAGPIGPGPRVEDEFLSPYRAFFASLPATELPAADGAVVADWVRDHITVLDDPTLWRIPASPEGVWRSRLADPRSRDLFYVALCRALGIDARKDPVTGKLQYSCPSEPSAWLDVSFSAPARKAPEGRLQLLYTPDEVVANPQYYSHFTLSRMGEDGRPHLLTFDEGEVDMGGGVDWAHTFREGFALESGTYLLVSGNRLSSGAVPVCLQFVEVKEGETTLAPLVLGRPSGGVPIIGAFDAESRFLPAGADTPCSLLSAAGRGYFVTALLDPGKEPTNHVLRDLSAARASLEAWGRPILLLCPSAGSLSRLQAEIAEGRYGALPATVRLGIDPEGSLRRQVVGNMQLTAPGRLPLVLLSDSFNRVFFCSEGYTIGLGSRLTGIIGRL